MKSFKQKIEEKRAILKQQRIAQEQEARLLREQQEQERLERQRIAKIQEAEQWKREQALYEEQLWEEQERKRLSELKLQRLEEQKQFQEKLAKEKEDWKSKVEFKSKQKSIIQEILNGEQEERNYIISERSRIESDLANERYLAKEEQLRLELEENERLQLEEMERIEAEHIAEQEKYALWERLEKEENDRKEKERLELLRIQEEDQSLRETAEMLERIEAERIEYEHRQELIAKRQQVDRENINAVLNEVQSILSSNKESSFKDTLTGLHDYIYRLNTNEESDPWTDRKQPIAILTWADWKQIPANESLIESDFKRARLLFEQDNMRAKRYHDHIYPEMPGRNQTLQRLQSIANENKLTGLPHGELVESRKQLVKELNDLTFWLDAGTPDSIKSLVTSSLASASISAFWKPESMININDTVLTDADIASAETANLEIISGSALFDNNPNTFMTIRHTSGSSEGVVDYDWNDRWRTSPVTTARVYAGVIMMRVSMSLASDKQIERVELYSTDRKFIPTVVTSYANTNPGIDERWDRRSFYTVTASHVGNYNSQIATGGEHISSKRGGAHGITAEGSASLDPLVINGLNPFRYYPSNDANDYDDDRFVNDIVIDLSTMATGSEVRFNQLKIFYYDTSGSAEHGQGIHCWKSQGGHISASNWYRTYRPGGVVESRRTPLGTPLWYSGSQGDPVGISMPYVQFSSESISHMSPYGDFNSLENGTTLFSVFSSNHGIKNYNGLYYGDKGTTFRSSMQTGVANFNKDLYFDVVDWQDQGELTSKNTRHRLTISNEQNVGELDQYGIDLVETTQSAWPYRGYDPLISVAAGTSRYRGFAQRETLLVTHQLNNPMEVSSSKMSVWKSGGTPFVDLDTHTVTDYILTGSLYGQVQLGADGRSDYWFGGRIHEIIQFNRELALSEIETVHNYLRDKWQVRAHTVHSYERGDFVYGVSSSISSQDTWFYDPTNEASAEDNIYSSSVWELK